MASQSEKKQHHRPHLSPPPVHAATVNNSDVPDLTAAAADKRGAIVFHSCIVVHTLKIDDHYQTKAYSTVFLFVSIPSSSTVKATVRTTKSNGLQLHIVTARRQDH
uniref:Uncharacterized protein n=1 Tax=Oryza sativa subsp. japonica TaxID=39947 RepID=Q6YUL1_ORYSJ|nr:hypothetical protein [Oryza sativa Japonica Group]BAD16514.1 hypothetical protein [Oryza sativa Japonica Group]